MTALRDSTPERQTQIAAASPGRGHEDTAERLARSHVLWQTTSDAVVMIDEAGTILFANPAVETIFGIAPAQLVGGNLQELQPVRLRAAHRRGMERYLQSGQRKIDWRATETLGLHRDGREFPLEVTFSDMLVDGRRVFAAGMRDISARKAQQRALEESEQQYRRIVETAVEGICTFDAQGVITFANATMGGMLGCPPEQMLGVPVRQFVHPDFHHRMRSNAERQRRGVAEQGEFKLCRRDGTALWAWVAVAPFFGRSGEFSGVLAMVSDITLRKEAENALRASEARFRSLTALSSDWYWEQDAGLRFVQLTGGRRGEIAAGLQFMVGKTLLECLSADDPQRLPDSVLQASLAARRRFIDVEVVIARPGGPPVVLSVSGEPIEGEDGRFAGYCGVARDLTDARRAEEQRRALAEQLRQAQKMEAIGVLAGGIAHDFNNVLAGILANAALARSTVDSETVGQSLDGIEKAGRRGRALVRQILSFAQRQAHEPAVLPLRPVVEETIALLRVAMPPGVSIDMSLDDEPITARVDASQIGQVLMNLVTNAWHAAQRKGTVGVSLGSCTLAEPLALATGRLPAGRYALLSVSDSGIGMSAQTQKRIFEPFFTTKPAGEGTGLGLSVVHGLVLGHGGGIAVCSEPGRGSTFIVYLPLADCPAACDDRAGPPSCVPRGADERILYIDDDEVLALVIDRLLQRQGYSVVTCRDAAEALKLVGDRPHDFDLVLTDYSMPGASGLDVARAVHDANPRLPVVMTSGNLTPELRAEAAALGVKAVVGKENCVEELAGVIHRILSARLAPPG